MLNIKEIQEALAAHRVENWNKVRPLVDALYAQAEAFVKDPNNHYPQFRAALFPAVDLILQSIRAGARGMEHDDTAGCFPLFKEVFSNSSGPFGMSELFGSLLPASAESLEQILEVIEQLLNGSCDLDEASMGAEYFTQLETKRAALPADYWNLWSVEERGAYLSNLMRK